MTRSPAVVFQALALKEGQDQQPPAALVEDIKKQDGFQRAFFGRKMEDPDTGVLCTGELASFSVSFLLSCLSFLSADQVKKYIYI